MLLMASIELRDGAIDSAEARARVLLEIQPKLALTHLLAADVAMARKRPEAALAALRKAHELQPARPLP
ncbi:MAG: hypothetical protein U1E77_16050 [Inhella sp.]